MTFDAKVCRVLIASPSDVERERRLIRQTIYEWDDLHSADMRAVLLPILWETHARPDLGDRPQELINRQIVRGCDILIGASGRGLAPRLARRNPALLRRSTSFERQASR